MNYFRLAQTTKRLIYKNGRDITLSKLDAAVADVDKPWRGAAEHQLIDTIPTKAVFAIGNTSIPTESRGLAFDWVDEDLLRTTRHVILVAALDLPNLEDYKMMTDAGKQWAILWGQCLQPGDTRILYVFGLKE